MKKLMKISLLVALLIMLSAAFTLSSVKADPLNVAWYVTDASLTPINGAHLTIYNSTSPNGPFTPTPASLVEDKIANAYQNPIISGYWNPVHPDGIALADLHIQDVSGYYFYVKIEYDSTTEYWPTATSYKPEDITWAPLPSTGPDASLSGYVAAGNGMGNGVTTAFPTHGPPPSEIAEVPLGPLMAAVSMVGALGAYYGFKRQKFHIPHF